VSEKRTSLYTIYKKAHNQKHRCYCIIMNPRIRRSRITVILLGSNLERNKWHVGKISNQDSSPSRELRINQPEVSKLREKFKKIFRNSQTRAEEWGKIKTHHGGHSGGDGARKRHFLRFFRAPSFFTFACLLV
jgi:hypothetical protein